MNLDVFGERPKAILALWFKSASPPAAEPTNALGTFQMPNGTRTSSDEESSSAHTSDSEGTISDLVAWRQIARKVISKWLKMVNDRRLNRTRQAIIANRLLPNSISATMDFVTIIADCVTSKVIPEIILCGCWCMEEGHITLAEDDSHRFRRCYCDRCGPWDGGMRRCTTQAMLFIIVANGGLCLHCAGEGCPFRS